MYVIEVMPLRRGVGISALSYFSKAPYTRGALVEIPLRAKVSRGVVLSCQSVSLAKAALRGASFLLRKLPPQGATESLPASLLMTADTLADYYATSPGAVLFALLPKEIKNGIVPMSGTQHLIPEERAFVHEILHAPLDARVLAYQHIVRTSFAQSASVVLVVPTIEEGEFFLSLLSSGIPGRAHLLHSGLGTRKINAIYAQFQESAHAMLTIATPQYAFFNRSDVGTVILEHSRAAAFRGRTRPYLDFRHALTVHARTQKQRLITADTLIRSEDAFLLKEDRALPLEDEYATRLVLPGTLKTIPLKNTTDSDLSSSTLFSLTLLSAIEKTRSLHGRTFLFSARRGLAPIVACADCGLILRCPESGSPLSLHRVIRDGAEERWLVSSVSGYRKKVGDLCPNCGSWRLRERGIGIQHVYDELVQHVPRTDVLLFDHHTASTHKKAANIRDAFYRKKGTVLLGTTLALPYLHQPIDMSAVVSMDALRAIPSWRQAEESLAILLTLREKTLGYVFVQTRTETDDIIPYAQTGETARFYTDELTARAHYKYPPYMTFIHLTWQKTSAKDPLSADISTRFAPFGIDLYPALESDTLTYGLIRVPSAEWPHAPLVAALRTLPPSVRVIVNPDRLL